MTDFNSSRVFRAIATIEVIAVVAPTNDEPINVDLGALVRDAVHNKEADQTIWLTAGEEHATEWVELKPKNAGN